MDRKKLGASLDEAVQKIKAKLEPAERPETPDRPTGQRTSGSAYYRQHFGGTNDGPAGRRTSDALRAREETTQPAEQPKAAASRPDEPERDSGTAPEAKLPDNVVCIDGRYYLKTASPVPARTSEPENRKPASAQPAVGGIVREGAVSYGSNARSIMTRLGDHNITKLPSGYVLVSVEATDINCDERCNWHDEDVSKHYAAPEASESPEIRFSYSRNHTSGDESSEPDNRAWFLHWEKSVRKWGPESCLVNGAESFFSCTLQAALI